jgi:hypothetical protein
VVHLSVSGTFRVVEVKAARRVGQASPQSGKRVLAPRGTRGETGRLTTTKGGTFLLGYGTAIVEFASGLMSTTCECRDGSSDRMAIGGNTGSQPLWLWQQLFRGSCLGGLGGRRGSFSPGLGLWQSRFGGSPGGRTERSRHEPGRAVPADVTRWRERVEVVAESGGGERGPSPLRTAGW